GGAVVEHGDDDVLLLVGPAVFARLLEAAQGPGAEVAVLAVADHLERLGRVAELLPVPVLDAEVVEGTAVEPQQPGRERHQQPARRSASHRWPPPQPTGLVQRGGGGYTTPSGGPQEDFSTATTEGETWREAPDRGRFTAPWPWPSPWP